LAQEEFFINFIIIIIIVIYLLFFVDDSLVLPPKVYCEIKGPKSTNIFGESSCANEETRETFDLNEPLQNMEYVDLNEPYQYMDDD